MDTPKFDLLNLIPKKELIFGSCLWFFQKTIEKALDEEFLKMYESRNS